MRRTLVVLVTAAAFLVPASAASATVVEVPEASNASCSNGKGGNGADYNDKGNLDRALRECGAGAVKGPQGNGPDGEPPRNST